MQTDNTLTPQLEDLLSAGLMVSTLIFYVPAALAVLLLPVNVGIPVAGYTYIASFVLMPYVTLPLARKLARRLPTIRLC